jgi:hypothetical protein
MEGLSMKKIAIVGRGTAGALGVSHFLKWTNWEIDWYFDDNIRPQAVGEGSTLVLPRSLFENLNFQHHNIDEIDGSFKSSIYKEGWVIGKKYHHTFPPPQLAYHFNANKLQDYILSKVKNNPRITIKNQNIKNDQIDSDFILDCSGKPEDYTDFHQSPYIPVNSVHVTQCYWDYTRFQYTLTIARPYGWVFGIPLRNRCSIGYMYNNSINTIEEVKEDVEEVFKQFDLTPSETTNSFSFNNYYKKENFSDRIAYNGNASFFLEPLEATSITFMDSIQRYAYDIWVDGKSVESVSASYNKDIEEIESMIMLHYLAGSIYKTPFWDMARTKAEKCLLKCLSKSDLLCHMVNPKYRYAENILKITAESGNCGTWPLLSWVTNMENLGVYPKIEKLLEEIRGG